MAKHRSSAVVSSVVLAGLLAVLFAAGGRGDQQTIQKVPQKNIRDKVSPLLNRVVEIPLGQGKPELCLEEIKINKAGQPLIQIRTNIGPGETIGLQCSVWNLGQAVNASQWWKVSYYIDGVLVGTKDMLGLGRGRGPLLGYECPAPMAEGVHYYECRLDMEGAIDEADKRNNRAEIPFRVGPPTLTSGDLPDLIVKEIRLEGRRIEVWVQNIGGKRVDGVDVLLYVNDSPWLPAVYRNATNLYMDPGDYMVFTNAYWHIWFDSTFVYKAVVDSLNKVAESNESNNSLSVRFIF